MLITVDNLSFTYPGGERAALAGIDLKIAPGEFIGITGPAGVGKSTLLACLNGIIPNLQPGRLDGRVLLDGRDIGGQTAAQTAETVGTVLQDPESQLICADVEEEVAFGPRHAGCDEAETAERVEEALAMVGAAHLRRRTTASLSGGEKQRVAIAAALAMRPRVLVLDEPTAELDPVGTEEIFRVLGRLHRERGMTVIIAEQKTVHLARHAGRIIVLYAGRVLMDGAPRAVFARQDELSRAGVAVPPVARLAAALGLAAGEELPLTVAEGETWVRRRLSR